MCIRDRERTGDLMYEDFKKGGWNVTRPRDVGSEEFDLKRKTVWRREVVNKYSQAIWFWLEYKQYDRAKRCADRLTAVSYTHLDVYKRQGAIRAFHGSPRPPL